MLEHPKPWSIQVELTQGCQRRCKMCSLNSMGIKPGQYSYMTLELAEQIAQQIRRAGWLPRIEFAMHGEPLLNPKYALILDVFRQILPGASMMMTTNGIEMLDGCSVSAILNKLRHLNIVLIDLYEPYGSELKGAITRFAPLVWDIVDFYDSDFSPWTRHPGEHVIVLMDDLMKRDGEKKSRVITNQGGNCPIKPRLDTPKVATCTLPFRELSIRWNGDVSLCCNDWKNEYPVGNILDHWDIIALWNHPRFMAARSMLAAKRREFLPCSVCDLGSGSRSGLLPKMEPVTSWDEAIVNEEVDRGVRY